MKKEMVQIKVVSDHEVILFGQKFMSKQDGWYYPLDKEGQFMKRIDKKEMLKDIKQYLTALDKVGQIQNIDSIRLSSRTVAFALFNNELDIKSNFLCKKEWIECNAQLNGHPHIIRIYPNEVIKEGIYEEGDELLT